MFFLYKTYAIEYEYNFTPNMPTLLLLHGWGGNKDSFIQIKKLFKSRYNILSISFPPYNDSCVPLDMYDYKNIVTNLLKLLNIYSLTIICHSFGMRVSLMLATTNISIDKIIITGGAGIKLKPNFLKKLTINFSSIFLRYHPEFFSRFASSDYASLSSIDKVTFKNIVNKDLTNHIKLLRCPALLFWGKKDTATPMKMLKIFKHIHHNYQCKIMPSGTHFCYLEHSQLFIDCCEQFLNT